MDKIFLSTLLAKEASRPATPESPAYFNDGYVTSSSITLYGSGAASPLRSASPATTGLPAAANGGGGGSAQSLAGKLLAVTYGGRPPEQLLYDIPSCDLVLVVSDEGTASGSRAVPVHKEVLRTRNPGGYFARLLADPAAFPEYTEAAAVAAVGGVARMAGAAVAVGAGAVGGAAAGAGGGSGGGAAPSVAALAGRPVLRRMQWSWPLSSCLLSFLYRDCAEATWGQLPALRGAAEEIGLKGLVEVIDALLDPQHLLPWTAADMRAAGLALRRGALVEAADRYAAAMRAAGVDENTRLANFVYHARQARPKYASGATSPTPGSAPAPASPAADGGGGGVEAPWSASAASAAAAGGGGSLARRSFGAFGGAPPSRAGSGGDAASAANFACQRDSRLGFDVVDGVFRSVAHDSRMLRALLLPGRRKEYVLLLGPNSGGVGVGGAGGGGGGRQRRLSNLVVPRGRAAALAAAAGGDGGEVLTTAPYGGGGGGVAGGGGGTAAASSPGITLRAESRQSLALPLLGSRIRNALSQLSVSVGGGASGGRSGGSSPLGSPSGGAAAARGGIGGGGGAVGVEGALAAGSMTTAQEGFEPWDTVEYLVMVPASQLPASLGGVVARPLDVHTAAWAGPLGPGMAALLGASRRDAQLGEPSAPGPVASSASSFTAAGAASFSAPASAAAAAASFSASAATAATAAAAASGGPSFNPFQRLSGLPGLSWGERGASGAGGVGSRSLARSIQSFASHASTHTGANPAAAAAAAATSNATAAPASASTGAAASANSAAAALGLQNSPHPHTHRQPHPRPQPDPRQPPPYHSSPQLLLPSASVSHTAGPTRSSLSFSSPAAGSPFPALTLSHAPSHSPTPTITPPPPPPAHLQLPSLSSLGDSDQFSLVLALECRERGHGGGGGGGGVVACEAGVAARLLASVLSTLAAMDNALFTVRMDAGAAAHAVAAERRRASVDFSAAVMSGVAGLAGGGGGGGGAPVGSARAVIGPANPRDYFIPLPDQMGGALAITLPLGLVLVDPAVLEAAATGALGLGLGVGGLGGGGGSSGFGSAGVSTSGGAGAQGAAASPRLGPVRTHADSVWTSSASAGVSFSGGAAGAAGGGIGGGGGLAHELGAGGGGGGSLAYGASIAAAAAARVAALVPHLVASGTAISQLSSAVGVITQVLRVAAEQHGVFGLPPLRACLRVTHPSPALLAALAQTNTYFAVEPHRSSVYIRKPPHDILRLLAALHSTLPLRSRASGGALAHAATPGPDMGVSVVARGRYGAPESYGSAYGGTGTGGGGMSYSGAAGGGMSYHGSVSNIMRGRRSADLSTSQRPGSSASVCPPAPRQRSSFELPHTGTATGAGAGAGGAHGTAMSYSQGLPYGQLERLFPGWHMHVVELSPPGVMVNEF